MSTQKENGAIWAFLGLVLPFSTPLWVLGYASDREILRSALWQANDARHFAMATDQQAPADEA